MAKKQHVFIAVESKTISRKACLPAYIRWEDVLLRGLLAVEAETEKINKQFTKGAK